MGLGEGDTTPGLEDETELSKLMCQGHVGEQRRYRGGGGERRGEEREQCGENS